MQKLKVILCLFLVNSFLNADIKPVINAGFSFGGDKLLEVAFDDGDSDILDAGDGVYIEGGLSLWFPELRNFDTQLLVGYSAYGIDARNGEAYLSKITIRAVEIYYSRNFNFGVGFVFHSKPEVDGEGSLEEHIGFRDAWGPTFQFGYNIDKNAIIGLRADFLEYDDQLLAKRNSPNRYSNANSFGLFFSYTFY